MSFDLKIPLKSNGLFELGLAAGESLYVLGANGTGKSRLMHLFYIAHRAKAHRVTAHRQTWFPSNKIRLNPEQRIKSEENILREDRNKTAIWNEFSSTGRIDLLLFDLVDAENNRDHIVARTLKSGDINTAVDLVKKDSPIEAINGLLQRSNMSIQISLVESGEIVASKSASAPYSIAELSDGERNALLIAASVLTVKADSLIIIDEPERHLHRSIISPFLTNLFALRADCAFIVSTHEVTLPVDTPGARTLLIRGCFLEVKTAWDVDLVTNNMPFDADLMKDILGARRNVIFVEGTEQSLDKPLYSLLFPGTTVLSKSSCRDVEHVVSSIRDTDELHWVCAFGIVDNDQRGADKIEQLKKNGIYALSVFAVESIYYHPGVQERVAERLSGVTGEDAISRVAEAKAAALKAITPHIKRLSERVAEKKVREKFFQNLPTCKDIADRAPINVLIDVAEIVEAECSCLEKAMDEGDSVLIIARYPVRETPALQEIVKKLGFSCRTQYESAVRQLLIDDEESLVFVRSLFGTLAADIGGV